MTTTTLEGLPIAIIGTSHISADSIKEVKSAMDSLDPSFVCIELDQQRLHALMTGQRTSLHPSLIRHIGLKGYIFVVFGSWLQRKLGRMVNMQPGQDMKIAAQLAIQQKKPLVLIDQPLQRTLQRFSKGFTWRERWRLFSDIITSPFNRKQRITIDLAKVPSGQMVTKLLHIFRQRYPSLYRVFVQERNWHMAVAVMHLFNQKKQPLLVVVGEGHRTGLVDILRKQWDQKEYLFKLPAPKKRHA